MIGKNRRAIERAVRLETDWLWQRLDGRTEQVFEAYEHNDDLAADIAMMAWEGALPEDEEVFDAQPRKTIPADEVADRLAETCCERGDL